MSPRRPTRRSWRRPNPPLSRRDPLHHSSVLTARWAVCRPPIPASNPTTTKRAQEILEMGAMKEIPRREPLPKPESAEPDWMVAMLDDLLAEQDARHAQLLLHRLA